MPSLRRTGNLPIGASFVDRGRDEELSSSDGLTPARRVRPDLGAVVSCDGGGTPRSPPPPTAGNASRSTVRYTGGSAAAEIRAENASGLSAPATAMDKDGSFTADDRPAGTTGHGASMSLQGKTLLQRRGGEPTPSVLVVFSTMASAGAV